MYYADVIFTSFVKRPHPNHHLDITTTTIGSHIAVYMRYLVARSSLMILRVTQFAR